MCLTASVLEQVRRMRSGVYRSNTTPRSFTRTSQESWRSQYPEHNINNLDTHGVLNVRHRECRHRFTATGTCDLNQVSVQLSRMDGIQWVEMSENDELFSKIPTHLTSIGSKSETMSNDEWLRHQIFLCMAKPAKTVNVTAELSIPRL